MAVPQVHPAASLAEQESLGALVQVLDRALREDFGFKHLLWVFSGRRGIHCWVSDRRARQLTDEARRAVANYLQLWKGEEGGKIKVRLSDPLHPAAGRAGTVLHRVWEKEVLPRQQILENPKTMEKVLSHIPQDCGYLADELRESWSTGGGRGSSGGNLSVDRWQQFKRKLQKAADGAHGTYEQHAQHPPDLRRGRLRWPTWALLPPAYH